MTTFTCPEGHQSADPEWCDTCGSPINRAPSAPGPVTTPTATVTPGVASSAASAAGPSSSGPSLVCSHCGVVNEADALFCESCGFDFTTGQAPPAPRTPVAVTPAVTTDPTPTDFSVTVSVDGAWYALQGADSNEACPPPSSVTLPVRGTALLIGRTSAEKGLAPEIALNDDPGVSRRHAQLVQDAEGMWSAVDQGSMNGTYVVADGVVPATPPEPIAVGEPVPLAPGAKVFVGAWSCITLIDHRTTAAAPSTPAPAPEPT